MAKRRKRHCCHKLNRVCWVKGHGGVMFVHWAATCFYHSLPTYHKQHQLIGDERWYRQTSFNGAYTAAFRVQLSPIVLVIVVYIHDVHSFLIWPLNEMASYLEKLRVYNPYYCSHCTVRPIFSDLTPLQDLRNHLGEYSITSTENRIHGQSNKKWNSSD